MLWIDPDNVTLGALPLPGVSAITVDRRAERAAVEWSDFGPHAVFADVPEQRTTIRLTRTMRPGDTLAPRPGDLATLRFRAAPSLAASGAVAISTDSVVLSVSHAADTKRGMTQTIDLLALSSDGALDPITETPIT